MKCQKQAWNDIGLVGLSFVNPITVAPAGNMTKKDKTCNGTTSQSILKLLTE